MPRKRETRGRTVRIAVIALAAALISASPAAAVVRYASPTSLDTVGACESTNPCRIDHAIGGAASGDEVVVMPGDYIISYQVRATAAINVHGAAGKPMPRLIGIAALSDPTLEMTEGGKVRRLYVETSAETALELGRGTLGNRLIVVVNDVVGGAEAVRLVSSPTPTALVNSVARTAGSGPAVNLVDGSGPAGGATLVNVTAIATGLGSSGVTTEMHVQSPIVRNLIARGAEKDLHGASGSLGIDVAYSNFRASGSTNWIDSGNNQQDVAPSFVNELTGDYREAAGSATIDAGTAHPLVDTRRDPDGRLRSLGAAPDIGAYEYDPAPATDSNTIIPGTTETPTTDPADLPAGGDPTPGLPAPSPPVLGSSVGVGNAGGSPLVRVPGSAEFVPLTAGATIPVGSTIDATHGSVTLSSVRDASGEVQTGTFSGGAFKVRQSSGRNPVTELVLTGGDFSRCRRSRAAGNAAYAARGRHSARVRRLWGRDRGGRFRTRGRRSQATVRGTVWLVEDRCDGTLTKVKQGAVAVRDFRRRRTVLVRAGGRYLARAR